MLMSVVELSRAPPPPPRAFVAVQEKTRGAEGRRGSGSPACQTVHPVDLSCHPGYNGFMGIRGLLSMCWGCADCHGYALHTTHGDGDAGVLVGPVCKPRHSLRPVSGSSIGARLRPAKVGATNVDTPCRVQVGNVVVAPERHRLSKSLSTPRKCSYCSKIMFFKAYRCKHCRYRCHKKCANHTHKRTQSCHKQYSGEEHWTKVLQANEVNSNLLLVPCHHGRRSHTYTEKAREMTSSRSLEESLLGSSGLDGADHHHHICAKRTLSDADGRSSSPSTPCSKDDPTKDANIFTKLYAKFCQWVATNKHPGSREGSATHTPRHRSRSSSIHSNRSQDLLQLLAHMPEELDEDRGSCIHHSLSSEESELYESLKRHHYSSTCSSLTITSTSTTTSDCPGTCPELSVSKASSPKRLLSKWINTKEDCKYLEVNDHRTRHSNLTFTISCPLRTKLPSQSVPEREKVSLCATWPLVSRRRNGQDSDEFDEYEESVFDFKEQESANTSDDVQLRESLGEFSISFPDLEFKECVRVGRRREVYRGQWHGDVMIHIYKGIEEEEVARFWSEVSKLSMIRHENVALFMGACIEHPQLAVVTSVRKGVPLYDHIHLRSEKMSLHSRVNVVKQIAQAMGYLHAKGLVLCKLNSRNITLEPKVKVSLMDFGMSERKFDRPGFGCVPRGHLTYTAPEMLRTLRVESPRLTSKTAHSTQTDVYAFGTLLFELMAGRYPFRGFTAEALVYNVAKGRRQSLKDLKCNAHLKSIIEQCWSYSPDDRPAFSNINKELQHNSALHKIHSSSVPERLNRAGLHKASDFLS